MPNENTEKHNLKSRRPHTSTENMKGESKIIKMPTKNSKIKITDVSRVNDVEDELNKEIKAH